MNKDKMWDKNYVFFVISTQIRTLPFLAAPFILIFRSYMFDLYDSTKATIIRLSTAVGTMQLQKKKKKFSEFKSINKIWATQEFSTSTLFIC